MNPLQANSQCSNILRHLKRGYVITPLTAYKRFGCLRLSERIRELEARGYVIGRKRVKVGPRSWVMMYWMVR